MTTPATLFLEINHRSPLPLYAQLYQGLQQAILSQKLAPGTRLPASRALATTLGVARNTVKEAYEQLIAEGYLTAQVGSGTYVTQSLPDDLLQMRNQGQHAQRFDATVAQTESATPRQLSRLGQALQPIGESLRLRQPALLRSPFAIGRPALDAFPLALWRRIASAVYKRISETELTPIQDPMGYCPLRIAIAAHLKAVRGIDCDAAQIVIVSGSQKGLYLTARTVLNRGDPVWLEEPGYGGAQATARILQCDLTLVSIDDEGLRVEDGVQRNVQARAAFVTPSHQFPLGHTMSLVRRLQLLRWAADSGSWIIEDDYDSEFRYSGRPLAALRGLDTDNRVIYVGTMSKVLFPALRLGYVVLPPDLVDPFLGVQSQMDQYLPLAGQMILAAFMEQGHFAQHIRRMLAIYLERRDALVAAVERELAGAVSLGPANCGMHVVARLAAGFDEGAIAATAAREGIALSRLSNHYLGAEKEAGFLLGFTGASPAQLQEGVRRLAQIIRYS